MRQSYYLRQRGERGLFYVQITDPITRKITERATGTNDEKKSAEQGDDIAIPVLTQLYERLGII